MIKTSAFGYQDIPSDQKSGKIRDLFGGVAANYDRMNDAMSLGVHRLWKREFIDLIDATRYPVLLDAAGGTGDIASLFLSRGGKRAVVADLTDAMMSIGKTKHRGLPIKWVSAPAENLPFEDGSFPVYTISFGLRNVTDIEQALAEAYRVLEPGGMFLCLEFSPNQWPLLSEIYKVYGDIVLPQLGEWIANDRPAYQYLVESIRRFPDQERLESMMQKAGFECTRYINLSGGICAIHQGYRL